ncbi:class I SAM-dependent methyltransferase [Ornithinibacillus salinisoli]|uniref:Class I SAM-dependent methyltransferase n=1 Tax=Ornithinibacillus salinisoli TaxID=1848459 RepID=A0ABW4VY41_9BACI
MSKYAKLNEIMERGVMQMLKGVLSYAHYLLNETVNTGELAIDATCGNGNDTLFLCKLVGEQGKVIAFDVQEQAIHNTKKRLAEEKRDNVILIQDSHVNVENYIQPGETISGAIFNLGYLPKSDKSIITKGESTVTAIQKILNYLKEGGLIVIVVYHGHPGGTEEKNTVIEELSELEQRDVSVLRYDFINQKNNPPFLIAIQKNKR